MMELLSRPIHFVRTITTKKKTAVVMVLETMWFYDMSMF